MITLRGKCEMTIEEIKQRTAETLASSDAMILKMKIAIEETRRIING